MANPTQNFGQVEKADLQHSTFDLSSHNFMTGRIGYLLPCYKREVLAGDKIKIQPNIDLQMSPTIKQLKTKLKMVIDYFFVPYQAVWKNYPYFVNQGMNKVGQVPTIPYHAFAQGSTAVCNGSLYDYLGVPTLTPQNATAHKRFGLCPYTADKNDSAYEQGYWFGLQANKANSWSADTKNSKSLRCGEFFSNVVKEYKKVPLEVLSKLHDKDSLGQHTGDSGSPFGKILHSVAIGSRIACSTDYIFSSDNPDADLVNPNNANATLLQQSTYFGNNGGKLKKNQYITKPIADNAVLRFPNSHCVKDTTTLLPTSSNYHSEVVVMFDYYGRPIKSYMNNTNTSGVDDFEIAIDLQNNSCGATSTNPTVVASPWDKYYTAGYILSKQMIDDINLYLTTDNGKKGVSFGFYTFYDKVGNDKLTQSTNGIWSMPMIDCYQSALRNNTTATSDKKADNPAPCIPTSSAVTQINISYARFYLGKSFTIPLVTSALGSIDVESTKPYALDANNNIAVKLNAFYARAYEAIYNYMYRNRNIDPLTDSSNRRVINQYLRDDYMTDGADTHDYKIHKALLEKDRFTTCLTASLINHTPLVGIRRAGSDTDVTTMTFSVDGSPKNVYVRPGSYESGATPTTAPHAVVIDGYDEGLPQGTLNVIKDTIMQGITIRDLQSVKQLQSWLHKHIECGYNFSEICLNTTGVKTKWNPNTSPMYLGGTAEILNNGNILSMAGDNLGERCGNPTAVSSHENSISFFAPDAGIVMGIVRLVPEVVYSQMIDPLFLKHSYWQFYNPSMDNKGYESITCKQFMPQLAYAESKLDNVFGYQVPWSDYKFTQDEAHADARTTEKDMLLMREFAQCPSLDTSFLECDPDDYDHIFRSTSSLDDKFYLVVYTQALFSRPIGNPQDIL